MPPPNLGGRQCRLPISGTYSETLELYTPMVLYGMFAKPNRRAAVPPYGLHCVHADRRAMKVLVKLFQKLAQWRARSPPRTPQSAKLIHGVSLFIGFLFAPIWSKRKPTMEFCYISKGLRLCAEI